MGKAAQMQAALASVLDDPVFARSPALTRLLQYLVKTTIAGKAKTLKSYSVAVEGLGKSPDFDSQADTYARVLVARLRKALETYYATTGTGHAHRLLIETGSYEVLLVAHGPASASGQRIATGRSDRKRIVAGAAIVLALTVLLILAWRDRQLTVTQRWRTSNFPFVEVSVKVEAGDRATMQLANEMRQSILTQLDNYEGIRTAYQPAPSADYSIEVSVRRMGVADVESISVIYRRGNRMIYSEHAVADVLAGNAARDNRFVKRSIFYISHPSGIIHSNERKNNYSVDTPYGCWLHFTATTQINQTINDKALSDCARDWYSAAGNHPLAAALYGWTLTDQSIVALTDRGHRVLIEKAVGVLDRARAINPGSPLLQVAAMRAYAYAGDDGAMRAAADQALRLNPDNLDVQGLAGVMLALRNDPRGAVLLNKAIAEHFNPPPWYFVGAFVAAMMQDDPAGARRALDRLGDLQHSLPVLPILAAAYQARTGHLDQARVQWGRATALQPVLRLAPDRFFSRLPLAPEVKVRLKQWLAPVLLN